MMHKKMKLIVNFVRILLDRVESPIKWIRFYNYALDLKTICNDNNESSSWGQRFADL